MSKVFFKIVVPNYNNMPYIKKCLDSILEQTFQDFCIVVVDDGSTDMSDKFCEMYAEKLPDKVKFLRLPKKGYAGAARNLALAYNEIEAQYVWFIDSDDWLYDRDVLKRMCSKIVESGYPDLLRCGAAFMYSKSRIVGMRAYKTLDDVASKGRCAPWWSCMKAKFSSIQFLEGRAKCNDVMWFAKLLDAVNQKSVAEVASPCVVYNVMSTTSAWHSGKKASKDCQKAMEQCYYDMLAYKPATRAAALFKQYTLKFCKKPAPVKKQAVAAKADASTKPAKQQKTSNSEVFFKIIIPNYNNMPYIKKCLDSVLNQTFQDFKIIVVDDMSTDMSDKFCEMYARQHPDKITFLRMDKKGHEGGCRNAGIDYPIKCKYYYFIDSDDYLMDNSVLEKCKNELIKEFPDILFVRMLQIDKNGKTIIPQPTFKWTNLNLFLSGFNSACIKFIKADKIQKFLENCDHAADVYQFVKQLDVSKIIRQFNLIVYVYVRNSTSVTYNGRYNADVDVFYSALEELSKHIKNTNVLNAVLYRINSFKNKRITF